MLDVYKASAGSGKTFALTLEYFRIIFQSPSEYKNILAVTFTNKATEEMKSRIIRELHRLALGEESGYGRILMQELKMTDEELKNKAMTLISMLLHDYGCISVTTIDRFFQRIIKAFTRELGIYPGYNVELDNEYVLLKAVDKVMQQVRVNPELRNWVNELMNSNVEEGRSWSVKDKIAELGAELFCENYMLFDRQLLGKFGDRKFLKMYRDFLDSVVRDYERKLTDIALRALKLIRTEGLLLTDFKGGKAGCVSWFYKLADGGFEESPTATVRRGSVEEGMWFAQNSPQKEKIAGIRPQLMDWLNEALQIFEMNHCHYLSARQLCGNLYQLGILNDLYQEVRTYCDENGLMLLSDTTKILNQLIAGNDSSFLYEKCGNYYKHLMIDEFQDTSAMQWNNFRPLVTNSLGERNKVMIVGDVKQSIYRWRNGDWNLLAHEVERQFSHLGVREILLKDNWRSAEDIVEFNNAFFEAAADMLIDLYEADAGEKGGRSRMIAEAYRNLKQNPEKKEPGYVEIRFGPERKEEESCFRIMDEVVNVIQDILERGGRLKDTVILVREGKEGAFVAEYLMEYNKDALRPVPFISNDSLYVWSSPYIQFIVALLKYIAEPYDPINKAIIVYFYHTFVKDDGMPLDRVFHECHAGQLFSALSDDFQGFDGQILSYSLFETVEMLINRFGLKDKQEEIPYLIAFQDIIYEYESVHPNSIHLFLEWWENEQKKRVLTTSEDVDAVRILTIHKSKGLEFGHVILPFCNWELDGTRPTRRIWCDNNEQGFNALEYAPLNYSLKLKDTIFRNNYLEEHLKAYIDNLNLLYVAFTRAKSELYILPYHPKVNRDGGISVSDIGAFIFNVIRQMRGESANEKYSFGVKPVNECKGEEKGSPWSLTSYPVFNPEGRISVKYRYRDFTVEVQTVHSAIDEGKLLHEIFRGIRYLEDIGDAVHQACLQGLVGMDEQKEYERKIRDYILDSDEASAWFTADCEVINEREILFPGGTRIRPDRIVIKRGKVKVIDYKFGQNEEKGHYNQVRFYCDALRKLGYDNPEGYIWYVKLNRINTL